MNFPLNFWTKDALIEKISSEQIILGIYYGAILIMIIYGMFLFFGFRDTRYIYFVLLLVSWGLTQLALNGLATQYLWSNWIWWSNVNIPFLIFAAAISIVHFTRSHLETKKYTPLADKILIVEFVLFVLGMLLSLIFPYSIMIKFATASALFTVIIISAISVRIIVKQAHRSAYYFIIAFGFYFFGIVLFSMKTFGVFPSNFLTNWSIQIGSFALVVFLSVAVQDRINRGKKEKIIAQQKALDDHQIMVKALKQSEHNLEEKIKERTKELNKKNQLLKHRANELASINRVSEQVNTSLNLNEVLQAVCAELVKIFEVRNAEIGLLDKAKTKLKIVAFRSNDPNDIDPIGMELALQDYEAGQIVINTKQPIAIANAQTDPRTKIIHPIMHARGTIGILIVPILSLKEVIGTIGMPAKNPVQVFSETEIELAKTIAAQVASSVENARLYARTEEALGIAERDLEIGHQIQSGFLPRVMPKIPDWEVASYFLAARQVAGDFYDAFPLGENNKIGIVVADVCDKGVGAALFMVVFRSLIRAFSEDRQFNDNSEEFLLGIVETVNKYITTTHGSSGMFATVFFGVLEPEKNTLFYVNAGHELPIVIDENGNLKKFLEPTGPAIGLMTNLTFAVDEVLIEKGDILVAYTDGVVDARNSRSVSFSEETLISQIKKPYPSAFSLLNNIENQLAVHVADTGQFDDITMLALRHKVSANEERHEISQLAILDNLTNFKWFIDQAGRHMGLQEDVIFAFKLAVEEACMNIITHGYKDSDPGQIKLTFERDLKRIVLTIYDEGIPFDPEGSSEADIESDWKERKVGGLGLLMIREMVDEISYESVDEKGNFLFLSKKID
jgi:sigma-B regulation protein RsbU (phosphoserine phosphatase)